MYEDMIKPIDGQKAFNELTKYILGKNYHVVDPLSNDQVNAIILEDIKMKYDRLNNSRLKRGWNKLIENLNSIFNL